MSIRSNRTDNPIRSSVPPSPRSDSRDLPQVGVDNNNNTADFSEWLRAFGFTIDSDGLEGGLLNSLGSTGKNLSDDFIKALFDNYLAARGERESREYNEQYNDPSAQLSRLLRAGMGREAALQTLQGVQSAAVAPTLAQGLSPSETAANDSASRSAQLNNALNIASTVFGSIGSIASLVTSGVNLHSLFLNANLLKASATTAEKTLAGMDLAGSVMGLARSTIDASGAALSDDARVPAESWRSEASLLDSLHSLASSGKRPDLQKFFSSPEYQNGYQSPYFQQALGNLFKQHTDNKGFRNIEDDNIFFLNQRTNEMILQENEVNASVLNNDFMLATQDGRIQIANNELHISNNSLAVSDNNVELSNIGVENASLNLKMLEDNYNFFHSTMDSNIQLSNVANDLQAKQFALQMELLVNAENDPNYLESLKTSFIENANAMAYATQLYVMEASYTLDQYNTNPQAQKVANQCALMRHYGFTPDFIQQVIQSDKKLRFKNKYQPTYLETVGVSAVSGAVNSATALLPMLIK